MPTSDVRSSSTQAYLLLALAGLCWSGNHVIGRAIAGHVPPVSLSALRWVLPFLIMLPFASRHFSRDWPLIRQHWKVLMVLGLSGGAVFSALQYVGLQYTSAVNVSVLNSLGPVFIVMAIAVMFHETLRPIQLGGIAISLTGVLFIVTRGELASLLEMSFNYYKPAANIMQRFADIVYKVEAKIDALREWEKQQAKKTEKRKSA